MHKHICLTCVCIGITWSQPGGTMKGLLGPGSGAASTDKFRGNAWLPDGWRSFPNRRTGGGTGGGTGTNVGLDLGNASWIIYSWRGGTTLKGLSGCFAGYETLGLAGLVFHTISYNVHQDRSCVDVQNHRMEYLHIIVCSLQVFYIMIKTVHIQIEVVLMSKITGWNICIS